MNFIGGIIKLDNIIIKKNWEEDNLLELKVKAKSKFVNAYQYCYIQGNELQNIGETIIDYVQKNNQECYVEFGEKQEIIHLPFHYNFYKRIKEDMYKLK